jgi:uncharacterized membrane protein (DUF2068 family)
MADTNRPLGITIIAILAAIGGIMGILGGFAAGIFGGAGVSLLGLVMLIAGVVNLVAAYGAWTLKPWAWTLLAVFSALGILNVLWLLMDSRTAGNFFPLVTNGIVLYYLFTPAVKAAFGRK